MLNRNSHALAKAVFRRWPEWRDYERSARSRDGKYFSVTVPPINDKVNEGLRIEHNIGYEIIVYFDVDHCHFWRKPSETPKEWMQRALDFADSILNDKTVAVSWWRGESLGMTSSKAPKKAKPNTRFAKGGNWTRWQARSWSGKYDRDEKK